MSKRNGNEQQSKRIRMGRAVANTSARGRSHVCKQRRGKLHGQMHRQEGAAAHTNRIGVNASPGRSSSLRKRGRAKHIAKKACSRHTHAHTKKKDSRIATKTSTRRNSGYKQNKRAAPYSIPMPIAMASLDCCWRVVVFALPTSAFRTFWLMVWMLS